MKRKVVALIAVFLIAIALFAEKTIDQQIADLEKKLRTVQGKEKIKALNEMSLVYRAKSTKKSIEYGSQALELSRKLKDIKGEATALTYISRGYTTLGDSEKALEFAEKSLNISEMSGDKKIFGNSLNNIGIAYFVLSNYDQALDYFQESLRIREEIGDEKGAAESLNSIANVYYIKSNCDKALEFYRESLKKRIELGDKSSIAGTLNNIGNVYGKLSDYSKSLEFHLEALKIMEEIGDKKGISRFVNNIGSLYGTLKNYQKALEYFLRSLKIKKEIGDKRDIANTLGNIGKICEKLDRYDKALEYHWETLKIRKETRDIWGISDAFFDIGVVYKKMGSYNKALEYYRKALKIKEEIRDKLGVVGSLYEIGEVCTKLENYEKALKIFEQGLKIAKEINTKTSMKKIYEHFSQLYAAKGDYKKAFEYHKLYSEIKDNVFNEKMSKQIAEMQTRYDTLKKEKEIEALTKNNELLQKNNEIQNLRLDREKITRNAFIIGFILVSIILVLLFRKYLYFFSFWKKQKYIGQFRLVEELGTGGMGTIYKAHNIRDKTDTAAVKILKPELFKDETGRKRFKQEATIIDKLDHPNIIKIIERGEYKETLFIAMELLHGKTLNVKIDEQGQVDFKECFHIMSQVSDALVLIHGKDIVHRDLKPSNIMLIERNGDPNFVKLLDFGLATMQYQTRITRTGILVGSFNYMSPEQLANSEFSSASDVYSLGVTFYEMTTGRIVFPGETANEITRQVLDISPIEPHRYRPDIPGELDDLIMKMLEKNKESRPVIKEVFETLQMIQLKYK